MLKPTGKSIPSSATHFRRADLLELERSSSLNCCRRRWAQGNPSIRTRCIWPRWIRRSYCCWFYLGWFLALFIWLKGKKLFGSKWALWRVVLSLLFQYLPQQHLIVCFFLLHAQKLHIKINREAMSQCFAWSWKLGIRVFKLLTKTCGWHWNANKGNAQNILRLIIWCGYWYVLITSIIMTKWCASSIIMQSKTYGNKYDQSF